MIKDLLYLYNYVTSELKNVPFDKGLPLFQDKLWIIANKYKTTGDVVFQYSMGNWSSFKNNRF